MNTERLLQSACHTIGVTKHFENTHPKLLLWAIVISTITASSRFRENVEQQWLLSDDLKLFDTALGVVIFTVREWQVNVNLLVPRVRQSAHELLQQARDFFSEHYPGYALELTPLRTHIRSVPKPFFTYRRVVPSRERRLEITLSADGRLVSWNETSSVSVTRLLTDPKEVAAHRPWALMALDDPFETTYWHRFECGRLAAFTNPLFPIKVPAPKLPDCFAEDAHVECRVLEDVRQCLVGLAPQCVEDLGVMVCADWVPVTVRALAIELGVKRLGLTDELLTLVGSQRLSISNGKSLLEELYRVADVFRVHRNRESRRILLALSATLKNIQYTEEWRTWMLNSSVLHALLLHTEYCDWKRACDTCDALYDITAIVLFAMLQHDDAVMLLQGKDLQKAERIIAVRPDAAPTHPSWYLMDHIRKRNSESRRASRIMMHESTMGVRACKSHDRHGKSSGRTSKKEVESSDPVAVVVASPTFVATHVERAARFASALGVPCELIGSGIFHDEGDLDVVALVPGAASLEQAYDEVKRCLANVSPARWDEKYERIDGEHVAVLSGTFEGHSVDVQVWRGELAGTTPAERKTRCALQLSRRLARELDDLTRERVRFLHRWASVAGLKGHILGCVSGVGLTCLAILATPSSLEFLLQGVRDILAQEVPALDFDRSAVGGTRPGRSRCDTPLSIVIDDCCVTARMTTGSTRHLLDMVSFAVSLPSSEQRRLDARTYVQWRHENMIRAVTMVVLDPSRATLALRRALCALDGHPIIESFHLEEDAGTLIVWVTLDPHVDATRYGIRDTDEIVVQDKRAFVVRGGRRLPLLSSSRPAHQSSPPCVTDVIHIGSDTAVFNAPSLFIDVAACFDARVWMPKGREPDVVAE